MQIQLELVVRIVQIFILVLLFLPTVYIFIFAVASLFYKQPKYPKVNQYHKMAVFIPGYKEDSVIVEVAKDALKQSYPKQWYTIYIIADSFKPETLKELRTLDVEVIEVSFEKSTKAKALNKAMQGISKPYDIAVVLDADNVMAEDFLEKMNAAFHTKCVAIQGHRAAKNLDTSLAILDAISEEINNNIFRKGHRVLGLSSAIIGSGMAFRYEYFKEIMASAKAIGGFDKEIELKMLASRHTIEYLHDAVVYDEKVQKAEVFTNQRRRWLSAQLHYFRQDFLSSCKALFTQGNVDYFDKAIQFIQPPRILLLATVIAFTGLFMLLNYMLFTSLTLNPFWLTLLVLCLLSFLFSVPTHFYNTRTLKALLSLPKGIFLMASSLLRIKGANKQFIHTQHSATTQKPK